MKRALKYFGITAAILLGLLIVLVGVIIMIPAEQYKPLLTNTVKSATGRDFIIGGPLEIDWSSTLVIRASDVRFGNAAWGSRPDMFTGGRIEAGVALMPLLYNVLDTTLILDAPDLLLETDAEGQGNWLLGMEADTTEVSEDEDTSTGLSLRPFIREVRFEQVNIAYLDGKTGEQIKVDLEKAHLASSGEQVIIELNGRYNDIPLVLSGGVNHLLDAAQDEPSAFKLSGTAGDITLDASGTLSALAVTADVDLILAVKVPTLAALTPFVDKPFPAQGPLTVEARLSGADGDYLVKDFKGKLDSELLTAIAQGSVLDLLNLQGIDLEVQANTNKLPQILELADVEVPNALPAVVKGRADISGSLESLTASGIQVDVEDQGLEMTATGEVKDILALLGIKAKLSAKTDSLTSLSKFTGTELPDSGPLSLDAKLTSQNGLNALSNILVTIKGDGVKTVLDGTASDLLAAKGLRFDVNVEAESIRQAARLAGTQLENEDPLSLKSKIEIGVDHYKIDQLEVKSGDSEATGNVVFKLPATDSDRSQLQGKLHVKKLNMGNPQDDTESAEHVGSDNTLTAPSESADTDVQANAEESIAQSEKVFPADPLPYELLRSMDADLELRLDAVYTPLILLNNMRAKLELSNGLLSLKPVQAKVGEGVFQAALELNVQQSPASLSLDMDLDEGTLRNFGGNYTFTVDLDGNGDSVAGLMAGLDGQMILEVRDAKLNRGYMTNFGRGLIDSLNPFDKESDTIDLTCAVLRFDITDGLANSEDKFVTQLTNVTWFGGGEVNLKTEELDFGAQPKPRKGLGVNLGLAGLVHIGGTLANPKIELDPADVAKKYGHYTLTIATGGLWLLGKGQLNKKLANASVCSDILAEREEKEKEKLKSQDSSSSLDLLDMQ